MSSSSFSDPRFARLATEPRFRALPRRPGDKLNSKRKTGTKSKIVVDDRFKALFEPSSEFKHGRKNTKVPKTDARGRRKINDATSEEEGLERFYELEEKDARLEQLNLLARGQASKTHSTSSSSSSESDDDSSDNNDDTAHPTNDATTISATQEPPMEYGEASGKRLAIVNCDWERIRAVDLLALLESFCPPNGRIVDVAIYPSQFGKEQMARESALGPDMESLKKSSSSREINVVAIGNDDDDGEGDDDVNVEGAGFDTELLRAYEKSKLKYFFAVCNCDSVSTAAHLYDQCDGMEFEHSAITMDLRFIPDDDTDPTAGLEPRDECSFVPHNYEPLNFENKALKQTRVDLTWDGEDPFRKAALENWESRGDGLDDLNQFIASSDSDDEDGGQDDETKKKNAERLRALLLLKPRGREEEEEEEEEAPSREKIVEDEDDNEDDVDIANLYNQPQKVQKDKIKPDTTKNNKKRNRAQKQDHEEEEPAMKLDMADERFAPLFHDPAYTLDPTDPRFKPTPTTIHTINAEKRRREKGDDAVRDNSDRTGLKKQRRRF